MNRNNLPMGRILAILLALLLPPGVSLAQAPPQVTAEEARKQEARASWQAAIEAATKGPTVVPLVGEAHLTLPRDMIFVPPAQAARMLRAWGNKVSSEPTGLIIGMRDEDEWVIVLRFIKEGYIKGDDAKEWNANELLSGIREGNEAANEDRRARGFSEVEIIGWIAPPAYDTVTHRLVSSIAQRQKDAPAGSVQGVNYDTYALGRYGYFVLEMLTNQQRVEHDRISATAVLAGLDYDQGHRYADFDPGTDHIAEYGLAALVGVVAAKKLGLLAVAGVFVLKFAKVGLIGLAVLGAGAARLFKRRNKGGGNTA